MPTVIDFKNGPGKGEVMLILEWPVPVPEHPDRYSELVINLGNLL